MVLLFYAAAWLSFFECCCYGALAVNTLVLSAVAFGNVAAVVMLVLRVQLSSNITVGAGAE